MTRHKHLYIFSGITALLIACEGPQQTPAAGETADVNDAQARGQQSTQDELSILIDSLRVQPGLFQQDATTGVWKYSGRLDLIDRIRAHGHEAVVRLVDCFDRTEPTQTALASNYVALGVMCSEALRHIAYYEAADEFGDIDATWPGYVQATSTHSELVQARSAWRDAVEKRSYALLP